MLMGWSAGCESWSMMRTLRLASIAAAVTMPWNVALSTACEQLKVKIKPPFDVNLAAQVAAIAALADKDHVKRTLELNAEGIKYLTPEFESLGFKVLPTQGNFICIHIGEKAKDLVLFLEKNGMIVRGLTSFGLPEHIRVTLGKREQNELLVNLVKKWKAEA